MVIDIGNVVIKLCFLGRENIIREAFKMELLLDSISIAVKDSYSYYLKTTQISTRIPGKFGGKELS